MKKSLLQIFSAAFCLIATVGADAGENKVVVTVGTQCITKMDIESRLKFVALMSGIEINDQSRQSLTQEAAKMLVQEQLQLQEMASNGLNIQEEAINLQLAEMAQRVGVQPDKLDGFFDEKGVSFDTVRQFVTLQYYWPQYIRFKYPTITEVSDDRIELMYKDQQAQKLKPRYLVAEIFIPVNSPAEESSSKQQIDMIYSEMQKGAQFPMLAQQFSQSPSARQGGNMGWITLDFLPELARTAIVKLEKGQATPPLRQEDGYAIYALIEKKLPGGEHQDAVFSLRQIIMNVDNLQEGAITTELKKCKNCEELDSILAQHPYIQVEKSDHMAQQQLNSQLSEMVSKIKNNELSEPLRYPQGAMYMWVCDRKTVDGTISKNEIRYRFVMQNLTQKSRSVLNKLSRTMLVDIQDDSYNIQL